MKKLLLALLLCGVAHAQVTPVIPSGTVLGNSSGSPAVPSALTTVPYGLGTPVYIDVMNSAYGAKCDGSTNDSAAFQAAINALSVGNGTIVLPPGKTCKLISGVTISNSGVHIIGGGALSTTVDFEPTANGALFTFSGGAVEEVFNSLEGVAILSNDTTHTKTAILAMDQSMFRLWDIDIGPGGTKWTGGSATTNPCLGSSDSQDGSIGFRDCGRDQFDIGDYYALADRPIVFSIDPNVATETIDHQHFHDLYLVNVAGVLNPLVWADSGVKFSSLNFDGYEAWVGGSYGFYFVDTTQTNANFMMRFDNVRWEQGTSPQYMFYISPHDNVQGLFFLNPQEVAGGSMFYVRNAYNVHADNPEYNTDTGTFWNADSSVNNLSWSDAILDSGASNTFSGQVYLSAAYTGQSSTIPINAQLTNYTSSTSSFGYPAMFPSGNSTTMGVQVGQTNTGFYNAGSELEVYSAGTQELAFNGSTIYIQQNAVIQNGASLTTNNISAGAHLLISVTAPTVTSGAGTSPSVTASNTAAFLVTEGASGSPATALVMAMPSASTGWACTGIDESSASITSRETAYATNSVTITFSSAPANSDKILFQCGGF